MNNKKITDDIENYNNSNQIKDSKMDRIFYAGFSDPEEAKKAGMETNWKIYPATPEGFYQARADGYTATSVCEFSHPVEKGKPMPIVYGDLYLDFDAKKVIKDQFGNSQELGDVEKSLNAIRIFISILIDKFRINTNYLKIWASGGKGFHLCIPRQLIGSELGDSQLPRIYRAMIDVILHDYSCRKLWNGEVYEALREHRQPDLEDFCIDSSTFKSGKGQLIRIPHIQRPDGNYKVPVTYAEITGNDEAFFREIVKRDRVLQCENKEAFIEKNSELEAWFMANKKVVSIIKRSKLDREHAREVETQCAFLEYCRDQATEVTEPQWFMLARILGHCGRIGQYLFHEYSHRDESRYNNDEAQKKLQHSYGYGIPTCEEVKKVFQCGKKCNVKCPIDLFSKSVADKTKTKCFINLDSGLFYYPDPNDLSKFVKICSSMELVASARDNENSSWSKIAEFTDLDGFKHIALLPYTSLPKRGEDALADLLNGGMRLEPGAEPKRLIMEYLQTVNPTLRGRIVERNGWVDVTTRKYVPFDMGMQETGQEYLTKRDGNMASPYSQAGTLQEWQDSIGSLCRENPLLMINILMGIAGPMLLPMKRRGFGIHLYGKSSSGKTTAIIVGSSVNGAVPQTWRATDNGLEGIAQAHNDNTLWLDEIGQAEPDVVGNVAYMLAIGRGKVRSTKSGNTKRVAEWNILFASTGEITVSDRANLSFKNKAMTGHDVRIINILADGGTGNGIFTKIPDDFTANTFSNHLQNICNKYQGTPLVELIRYIKKDRCTAIQVAKDFEREFLLRYDTQKMNGQTLRVLGNLSFLAGVGELAIELGILPWESGEAYSCADFCFKKWLENGDPMTSGEIKAAVNTLISQIQNKFFGKVDDETGMIQKTTEHDKSCYHISRQYIIRNICKEYYYDEFVYELMRMGVLVLDKSGKPREQSWINNTHTSRGFCVYIDKLLRNEDDEKNKDRELCDVSDTEQDIFLNGNNIF